MQRDNLSLIGKDLEGVFINSRERIRAAMDHKPADRVPARLNAYGPEPEALAKNLGISLTGNWLIPLHERLRIDMVKVEPWMTPAVEALHIPECDGPWLALERLDQVDRRWADLHRHPDSFNYDHLPAFIESWDATGNPPAIQLGLGGLFGVVRRLRGDTQALIDLAEGHEIMIHILDTLENYCSGLIDKAHSALGGRIDQIYVGDELGMQTGLMYSPASIREFFFPRFKRLFARCHRYGYRTFYHSCGAIEPLIPDLIDLGVDVLNPIQPYVPGMDPEGLAAKYGGRICFCGGLDMQRLMPFGTPAEIRAEARRYMKCLSPGYILDYANVLHPDIPTENTLALYDAPRTDF